MWVRPTSHRRINGLKVTFLQGVDRYMLVTVAIRDSLSYWLHLLSGSVGVAPFFMLLYVLWKSCHLIV